MAETIHVLTEGGTVMAMDLPLLEAIAERMAAGLITRVNEDGSPYLEPAVGADSDGGTEKPAPRSRARGA